MSLFTMAFMGVSPLGSLLAGYLAQAFGPRTMLQIGGVSCLCGAVLFGLNLPALRELIRPIYRSKGILPPLYAGVQSASELMSPPQKR